MKKFLALLAGITLTSFSIVNVVSCESNPNLDNNYTDEEKIMNIRNLTTSSLKSAGVKVGNSLTSDEVETLFNRLNLKETLDEDAYSRLSTEMVNIYIMANSFLNEISTKVSGYDWIAKKVAWQSQWTLRDLFENKDWGVANNVSGWMEPMYKDNGWSLSVTFLDSKTLGWTGDGPPKYARVNINKRLVANEDGDIIDEQSNPDAIRKSSVNALDSIFESARNIGPIYNGYASSSDLILLDDLFQKDNNGLNPGFINYSPSVMDIINNIPLNFDFGNDVLKKSKELIEEELNNYLIKNPIYLNETSDIKMINIVLKNQIYSILFSESLKRRQFKDDEGNGYTKEQMNVANKYVKKLFNNLFTTLTSLLREDFVNSNEESKKFLEDFSNQSINFSAIDSTSDGLTDSQIETFKENLLKAFEYSRNTNDVESGQKDFGTTMLTTVNNKIDTKNSVLKNEEQGEGSEKVDLASNLVSVNDYLDFGIDNSYKLVITYYSLKVPKKLEDFKYNPDATTSNNDQFYTDLFFKSVFFSHRFKENDISTMIGTLNKKTSGDDVFNYKLFDLNISSSDNEVINYMDEMLKKASDTSGNVSSSDWRVYLMVDYYLKNLSEKLWNILADVNYFHDEGISLDYKNNNSPGVNSYSNADDDEAFASLVKNKTINVVLTDNNGEIRNNKLEENLYNQGIDAIIGDISYEFYLYKTSVNIFGKAIYEYLSPQNASSNKELYTGIFKASSKVSYDNVINSLRSYWNKNVKENSENPDSNY
ncbi:hypothetical protein SCORR_v1c02860 [Spiroplasma corruscae]|uniref:Lipoprotein n=1 Tax=Spiroplasma corruscae TaxID=216934 RepID=A0A222ENI6_9MOLU|nr:hypothetical protein [Spiroplasma corruscae]ASP28060.1 hypothetical protein SCORR_v1c02860 [Spiroplasma corruscae]